MVQWCRAGLQVNKSSDRSGTWGMSHIKIHHISPGCHWPRIASVTLETRGLKHYAFIHSLHIGGYVLNFGIAFAFFNCSITYVTILLFFVENVNI